MGYTTSTVHGIQVPDSAQANNIPNDLGLIVTALEGGSLVKRLTQAQINALTSPQKPAGLVVYNTTTNVMQISDGSNFQNVPSVPSGAWTSYTPTITAATGTPTSVSATGKYLQVGKLATVRLSVSIVSAGTAAGYMFASLPVAAAADYAGVGASFGSTTGEAGQAYIYSNVIRLARYDVATFWANGRDVHATVTYEVA